MTRPDLDQHDLVGGSLLDDLLQLLERDTRLSPRRMRGEAEPEELLDFQAFKVEVFRRVVARRPENVSAQASLAIAERVLANLVQARDQRIAGAAWYGRAVDVG